MSFSTAMQRTASKTSTSYQASAPRIVSQQFVRSSARRGQHCSAYNWQNCGPRNGYPRGFGPMSFGDGAMAAVQFAEMMNNFAKSVNANTPNPEAMSASFLPVDVEEQESKYLLIADIPGLEKADLKISINQTEQSLKISGERQRAKASTEASNETSKPNFRRQYERGMGKFQRTISGLPKNADFSSVSAKVDKGVLTITVQKKDLQKDDKEIRIDID